MLQRDLAVVPMQQTCVRSLRRTDNIIEAMLRSPLVIHLTNDKPMRIGALRETFEREVAVSQCQHISLRGKGGKGALHDTRGN
jgi:hypothetical protein